MTEQEFRTKMLLHAVLTAKLLAEYAACQDIQKEPEQVRKNASTILTILTETEDFLKNLNVN